LKLLLPVKYTVSHHTGYSYTHSHIHDVVSVYQSCISSLFQSVMNHLTSALHYILGM